MNARTSSHLIKNSCDQDGWKRERIIWVRPISFDHAGCRIPITVPTKRTTLIKWPTRQFFTKKSPGKGDFRVTTSSPQELDGIRRQKHFSPHRKPVRVSKLRALTQVAATSGCC